MNISQQFLDLSKSKSIEFMKRFIIILQSPNSWSKRVALKKGNSVASAEKVVSSVFLDAHGSSGKGQKPRHVIR